MEYDFRCFSDYERVEQPHNSYWCWAASLMNIFRILHIHEDVSICDVATQYKKQIDITVSEDELRTCCEAFSRQGTPTNLCDITIDADHLAEFYSRFSLHCEEIPTEELHGFIYDYEAVTKQLEEKKAPIVLMCQGAVSHITLIIGFGYYNDCKYYLISDPIAGMSEKYIRVSSLKTHDRYKPLRAWSCASEVATHVRTELPKDTKFTEKLAVFRRVFEHNALSFSDPKPPLNALSVFSSDFQKQLVNENPWKSKTISVATILSALEALQRSCSDDYLRSLTDYAPINTLIDALRNKHSELVIPPNKTRYLEEFATEIVHGLQAGERKIKPVRFPNNYSLSKEWQSVDDFEDALKGQPKIQYVTPKNN
ncbi:hypothetical protein [Altibacter sp. HG106]|uniref:hypothetical protein n=1 Tax=Altibacter sp. HG106 TaxID=3023937 RepID=UPI0023504CBF|nr:hypothetical protein [Altibacter sp. HG106]MDC7995773.1 hypothetical protein [Altibacter sp. HG106]